MSAYPTNTPTMESHMMFLQPSLELVHFVIRKCHPYKGINSRRAARQHKPHDLRNVESNEETQ
jgi:hypothetical protein